MRILRQRLRSLFRRSDAERELGDELALHLEQLQREYKASGMSERDARDAARRAFGTVDVQAEECRDNRGVRLFEDASADVGYAVRLLAKSPGFTATAVLSLALGVGANTAMYGLIKQVILGMLPVRDAQQIVAVSKSSLREPRGSNSFSLPFLRDLQTAENLPFAGFLGYDGMGQTTMVTEAGAEPVSGELVTGNYFELLGVAPALGRLFGVDDDEISGGHPVAVLSHNFWRRRFAADPSVLNRSIRLNGHPFTVIGVSATGFDGLNPGYSPDVRVPMTMAVTMGRISADAFDARGFSWLSIYGRLRPGTARSEAAAALMPLMAKDYGLQGRNGTGTEYQKKLRDSQQMHVMAAAQGTGSLRRTWERAIWVLAAMVAAVLLLGCVNIAHLLLARGSARRHEFQIRLAIGASRGRLIRQMLTENVVVGVLGGIASLVFALGFGRVLLALVVPDGLHSTLSVVPDSTVLAFNFGAALLAALAFGLVPALQFSRPDAAPGLKGVHSDSARRLLGRKVLIGVQVATSLVLLSGAGLFVRSLINLRNVDVGFPTGSLLQLSLNPAGYAPDRLGPFYEEVLRQVRSLPGVESAAIWGLRVISGAGWSSGIAVEGYQGRDGDEGPNRDAVGASYFSTLGIPLIAGREFNEGDTSTSPRVAIVNEAFARFYFGNENPLGKWIGAGGNRPEYTIVGVTKNTRHKSLRAEATRFWYVPLPQMDTGRGFRGSTLFVRTASSPEAMANSVRAAVSGVDRNVALFDVRTLRAQVGENLRRENLLAALSTFFGLMAALLAGTGLFGVLSYSVSRRKREIGIRMAVGARPGQASWAIVRGVVLFVVAGVAAGTFVSFALGSMVRQLLFGVPPADPIVLAGAAAATLLVAALAALFPARMAAGVQPASALRAD